MAQNINVMNPMDSSELKIGSVLNEENIKRGNGVSNTKHTSWTSLDAKYIQVSVLFRHDKAYIGMKRARNVMTLLKVLVNKVLVNFLTDREFQSTSACLIQ